MATITATDVKKLRDQTGAGMMECKKALSETQGNLDQAIDVLRKAGMARASSKAGREARQGLVHAYIHPGDQLGVLIEVSCETDFVARTDDFRRLARELAMQVAAAAPEYVTRDEVAEERREEPDLAERVLLEQPYIRDPRRTVADLVTETVARVGENIQVRRFARFRIGE